MLAHHSILVGLIFILGAGSALGQSDARLGQGASGNSSPGPDCKPSKLVDVLTQRNNNERTGANLDESCLTQGNVNAQTFGKLFTLGVRGQIYAQPLIVSSLWIDGKEHNVAFIATMENWVYAFDADGLHADADGVQQPYWSTPVGPPLPVNRIPRDLGAYLGKYNISPYIGITSTPVIDRDTGTMFLVAKIARIRGPAADCDGQVASAECPVENWVFALDIITGKFRDKKKIQLPYPEQVGMDCGFLDNRKTSPQDAGRINMQRPALLYTPEKSGKGHIYLGFGSHQDAPCPMYHGMLIGFDFDKDPSFKLTQFPGDPFMVTQPGDLDPKDPVKLGMGGIWQAGNGPAADESGNIYIMTGNGGFQENQRYGSNFVKLSPDLKKVDWFAPWNVEFLNDDNRDIDLGATGPVLLPGKNTNELVGGGKQGKLYLLNRENLGHQQKFGWPHAHTDPPIQYFWAARRWAPEFIYGWFPISLFAFATGYHHIHGAPAFWGDAESWQDELHRGSLYVWPERDHLKAFQYKKDAPDKPGTFTSRPVKKGPEAGHGMPGGFLSISANRMDKDTTGILWAALPMRDDAWIDVVRGALRAFSISPDGSKLDSLWTSYCAGKEDRFDFSKYVPPTVANAKVYLATFSGFVNVYGLLPHPRPPDPNTDPDCKVSQFTLEPSYRRTHRAARERRN